MASMTVGDEVHFEGLEFDAFLTQDESIRDSVVRYVQRRATPLDSKKDFKSLHTIATRCLNFLREEGGELFSLPNEVNFQSLPRPASGQTSEGFVLEIGGQGVKSIITPWGSWECIPPQFDSFGSLGKAQARSSILARLVDIFDGKKFISAREEVLPIQGRYGLRCIHFLSREADIELPWPSFIKTGFEDEAVEVIRNWKSLLIKSFREAKA